MKILMVEDERRLSEAVAHVLKKNRYTVDMVFDGEDGLDYALTGVYDMIILDIMLPKRDGISVLREIRKHHITTPVIMLTAKGETYDKINGLDNGADDYLTKPFATEELLARLRALGRRPEQLLNNGILSVGNMTLQPNTLLLSAEQKKVKLTAKECQIMELLMRRQGMITSKDTIIGKVWGLEADIDEHSVETYISFLRKKIALIDANALIRVERGIGYLLIEEEG